MRVCSAVEHGCIGCLTAVSSRIKATRVNMQLFGCLALLVSSTFAAPLNETIRVARQAYSNIWPNGIIPVAFNSAYPEAQKAAVRAGMKRWEMTTCVRFRDGDTTSKNRIEIYDGGSCQSSVGIQGGKQTASLGSGCNGVSTTAHELGHALGLHHMQVRPDRNNYITVYKDRIIPTTYDSNYGIDTKTKDMGLPYDYSSLLHYTPWQFLNNPSLPGIVPRDARFRFNMGGLYPSFYDTMRVNKMYCPNKCASYRTTCQNNGVPDVNDCSKCYCPIGWEGRDCSQNPAGSVVLNANTNEQTYSTTLGNSNDPQTYDYTFRHIVINAPANRRVSMRVTYLWVSFDDSCTYGGIQVFGMRDARTGAPRACKMEWIEPSYTSEGNRMYIRLYKRVFNAVLNLSYKAI